MNQNDNRNQQDQDKINKDLAQDEQGKQQPDQSQKTTNHPEEGLKKSELPDNISQGATGSGQRQDSN